MSRSFVNPLVQNVPPSGIRRFFDIAGTMQDAISLGVGEPDFVTPYHIRNAAMDSILDGETQYTPNKGLPSLLEAISVYLKERFSASYDPEKEIMVTVGASEAIDLALRTCIQPGDDVLVPDPGYVSYAPNVSFVGGHAVSVVTKAEDQFRMTEEGLENAVTRNTKALILPYPNNPTGAVMGKEDLEMVARFAEKHDLLVISDEIYGELIYEGELLSFAAIPGMKERTILINGFSKAFAMTGWRLGYACAPREILSQMNKIHQYTIMCASRQAQVAGRQALVRGLENNFEDVTIMRESYNRRRRVMLDAFRKMGLDCFEPKGAFYCFPSVKNTGLSSEEFCSRLLQQHKVVCVPGTAFGDSGAGHIRCCYATDMNRMLEAFERMKAFLNTL
ncbi:MAG: aminotransferase class I/II-fold pyridoxal phosphate-dependent enzyme [Clostridia bacterium]|nr:aminotransferase class I/II-fold pyridoxal phosphate-dependent enzyme [Clostridia bacterium]